VLAVPLTTVVLRGHWACPASASLGGEGSSPTPLSASAAAAAATGTDSPVPGEGGMQAAGAAAATISPQNAFIGSRGDCAYDHYFFHKPTALLRLARPFPGETRFKEAPIVAADPLRAYRSTALAIDLDLDVASARPTSPDGRPFLPSSPCSSLLSPLPAPMSLAKYTSAEGKPRPQLLLVVS